LSLIHIPAGDFLMGADRAKETRAPENEQPLHRVSLAGYYLGKHPITNAQYGAFVEATGYQGHEKWDVRGIWILAGVRYPTGDRNHPATYVSWVDAMAFCNWLSEESGYLVRLPTEAGWEKAARGIDGRVYPWGNDWDYKRLNTIYNQPDSVTAVGSYSPHGDSPYGLTDMAGNVWEWCADWYNESVYRERAGNLVVNPTGPADGDRRVVRGGSWSNDRIAARTTFRNRLDPHSRLNNTGFRVALIKPDEP
ncbi:MAG: formylglycine-generating enzyme family protein, partial [Anaerolineae bacterium]|nr:formylglycine-generating enzyme family protein [Anaerolineae bacterium]